VTSSPHLVAQPSPRPPLKPLPFTHPPWNSRWLWLLLALLLCLLDYRIGRHILFPVFFIVPVALAAWNRERSFAFLLALLLTAARLSFEVSWDNGPAVSYIPVNAFIRLSILAIVAFFAGRVAEQHKELSERVEQLEGLLPICSHCHRIRESDESWTRLEKYISRRSHAHFSHGICPDCMKQHYGDTLKSLPE
jgi:K+-sensing histidine kinase KdpD